MVNASVVVDYDEKRLDIFVGERGFLTCHNLFAGDEGGIANYGFSEYSLCELDNDEINNSHFKPYIKNYRFYHQNKKTIAYLSCLSGQLPFVCNEKETFTLSEILQFLLHIQSFFENGEEVLPPTKEDLVCIFDFNDAEMMYDSSYELLENYDFTPKISANIRKQKKMAAFLNTLPINSGTLHIDNVYGSSAYDHYDFSNNVSMALLPIILYGVVDDTHMEYEVYSSKEDEIEKNLKTSLSNLLSKTGLYDTIITSNAFIYILLKRNLIDTGIEVILDNSNKINALISTVIKNTFDMESNFDLISEFLDDLRLKINEFIQKFQDFEEMIQFQDDSIFEEVEIDDETLDEFDDLDFETDPNNVC